MKLQPAVQTAGLLALAILIVSSTPKIGLGFLPEKSIPFVIGLAIFFSSLNLYLKIKAETVESKYTRKRYIIAFALILISVVSAFYLYFVTVYGY